MPTSECAEITVSHPASGKVIPRLPASPTSLEVSFCREYGVIAQAPISCRHLVDSGAPAGEHTCMLTHPGMALAYARLIGDSPCRDKGGFVGVKHFFPTSLLLDSGASAGAPTCLLTDPGMAPNIHLMRKLWPISSVRCESAKRKGGADRLCHSPDQGLTKRISVPAPLKSAEHRPTLFANPLRRLMRTTRIVAGLAKISV